MTQLVSHIKLSRFSEQYSMIYIYKLTVDLNRDDMLFLSVVLLQFRTRAYSTIHVFKRKRIQWQQLTTSSLSLRKRIHYLKKTKHPRTAFSMEFLSKLFPPVIRFPTIITTNELINTPKWPFG